MMADMLHLLSVQMNVHVVEVNRALCTFILFVVVSKNIHLRCETIGMVVSLSCGSCSFKFYGDRSKPNYPRKFTMEQ